MVGKSPKYSHQSNGAVEYVVRRIESLTRTFVCVLQGKLGYKVDSKSIGSAVACQARGVRAQSGRSALCPT